MKKNILNGTAVAYHGKAVFLRGPSGAGKSDLGFRLMNLGFALIADDQAEFRLSLDRPHVSGIESVKGLIEIRGVGLVKVPLEHSAELKLIVDLVPRAEVPRMPEWKTEAILGVPVARLALHAFDSSTPLKILKALALVDHPDLLVQ